MPIIVITARDDDATIVRALDAGADDYVVKPFGADQVAARVRAVLRRGGVPAVVRADPRRRPRHRRALAHRSPSPASRSSWPARSSTCSLALAQRPGEVVTKRELLAEVWRQAYGGSDRTVDVHLSWLRRKLGETAAEPRYLISVRGVGVRLVDPDAG